MAYELGAGEIGPRQIRRLLADIKTKKTSPTLALQQVGTYLPRARWDEMDYRVDDLDMHRGIRERWSQADAIPITPSETRVARDLDARPLALATWITTGSWKIPFLRQHMPTIKKNIDAVAADAILRRIRRQIGPQEYIASVADFIFSKLEQQEQKDSRHRIGNLTVGMELEVQRDREEIRTFDATLAEQTEKIDALQHVGIPVSYDAVREIPLPKSLSSHDQLRAFLLLLQSGIIESGNRVGLHLNIGGLRLDENIYLLEYMKVAAGLFEGDTVADRVFHPLAEENRHWSKTLSELDWESPRGLPFRIKRKGVMEFRWLALTGMTDFNRAAKAIETFTTICESVAAWQKVNEPNALVSKRDVELAKVWDALRVAGRDQLESLQIPNAHFGYTEDAEACADLEMHIRDKVATRSVKRWGTVKRRFSKDELESRAQRRKAMYQLFIEARKKINAILVTTPDEINGDHVSTEQNTAVLNSTPFGDDIHRMIREIREHSALIEEPNIGSETILRPSNSIGTLVQGLLSRMRRAFGSDE